MARDGALQQTKLFEGSLSKPMGLGSGRRSRAEDDERCRMLSKLFGVCKAEGAAETEKPRNSGFCKESQEYGGSDEPMSRYSPA
jgi:hypothetical protein